jgi:hypothetical protein
LLIAGVLVAGCYFDGGGDESEIRELADAMYRRVDWRWAQNGAKGSRRDGSPNAAFSIMAGRDITKPRSYMFWASARRHSRLRPSGYVTWGLTYQWENLLGRDVLYSGPLFTHLFSHAWIDFRGIRDAFMREKPATISRIPKAPSPSTANMANAIRTASRPIAAISGA